MPRQETDIKATTNRADSAQREDPVAKELRFNRVTKEVKKNKHKAEAEGGQEAVTEEDARKKPKTEKVTRI